MASSKKPATRHLVNKAPGIAVKSNKVNPGALKAAPKTPMKGSTKPMGKKGC